MNDTKDKYYIFFEDWSLDPNQWSMIMDGTAVILTILGFMIAFMLYKVQRRDTAADAHRFFIASLPGLQTSIDYAISDLEQFKASLDLDEVVDPVLSASLNDKFLEKVNLVALNRYYVDQERDKLEHYNQLLVDSNFFGDYRDYITNQIKYFRSTYLEEKEQGSDQLQRMKEKIKLVLERDIKQFKSIMNNLETLKNT